MDDNRGHRRQDEPPVYPASSSRQHQPLHGPSQHRAHSFAGAQGGRFRPAPIATSAPGTTRGIGGSTGYSTYYSEHPAASFSTTALPQGAMGYHSTADYGQADSRQQQSFGGTYPPTMMYNVQQTGGPQATSVYDASPQYPSRQAAALPMMATDVTGPYFPSEPTNAAGPSALQAQAASSSTAQVYQQPGLHGYSTGSMATMGGMATSQTTPTPDVRMDEEYPTTAGLDEAYTSYQTALKEIFQNIRNGVLADASESLLGVSDWLLNHVVELGLTSDDQNLHEERIKLWNDFNHAWLAIFQRQKEMMESGQQLQRTQTLIPHEGLKKMGKSLVRYCDNIERHGLVDYQYGVWEEQIVDILGECLTLYESAIQPTGDGGEGIPDEQRR
ncbi:uncharacterized protein B0T15DRAFT_490803 [Chaetomium strumarium]|uniref:Uncharacterized protein n=1 Tax=Chaetomium strumarium TaxID=1170767 RepID=A0AAJ0GXX5_9PEZI|nr:hypothetical protein B0T15DRAFT_490803 [Chaetomium strumarium]